MPSPPCPRPETTCARPPAAPESVTEPLAPVLSPSVVYRVASLEQVDAVYQGESPGFIYSRDGHPNAMQLASKVAVLEGAEAALVCASGMAAESALLLSCLESGDHVALSEGVYGKTSTLVARELARFGVRHSVFDATRAQSLAGVLTDRTRLVFAETISNPLVRVADLQGLADVARRHGALLTIDNTFAPLLCRPLDLGAAAVLHSATKLMGGHSDLMVGLLAGGRSLIDRATSVASAFGLNSNAFESWLALRGLATLGVRSARACSTALTLAERLAAQPQVKAVHYPGLQQHPDHERAIRLLSGGFGTIATIDLATRERAGRFIRALKEIPFAPSLGDVATTLSHPATTSHRGQSPEEWAQQGITPGLIRLSVGLEDPEDLWAELSGALGDL